MKNYTNEAHEALDAARDAILAGWPQHTDFRQAALDAVSNAMSALWSLDYNCDQPARLSDMPWESDDALQAHHELMARERQYEQERAAKRAFEAAIRTCDVCVKKTYGQMIDEGISERDIVGSDLGDSWLPKPVAGWVYLASMPCYMAKPCEQHADKPETAPE